MSDNRGVRGEVTHRFFCAECRKDKAHTTLGGGGTGYATYPDGAVCYGCCAARDRREMDRSAEAVRRDEPAHPYCLYLSQDSRGWRVTNWPETLAYKASRVTRSKATTTRGKVVDCYRFVFRDHKGRLWRGVNPGDQQLAYCRPARPNRSTR